MRGTILIIDDNPVDIKVLSKMLEVDGYVVQTCVDALKLEEDFLDKEIPRIIYLDLQMPTISGFEVIKKIRKHEKAKDVPIVIVSGRKELADVKTAVGLGANDFVIKPIDPLVLKEKLARFESAGSNEFKLVDIKNHTVNQCSVRKETIMNKISEFGMEIRTEIPLKVGETLEIADLPSELFEDLRIFARCLRVSQVDKTYTAQLTFVGLTEPQRQIIRRACKKLWVEPAVPLKPIVER